MNATGIVIACMISFAVSHVAQAQIPSSPGFQDILDVVENAKIRKVSVRDRKKFLSAYDLLTDHIPKKSVDQHQVRANEFHGGVLEEYRDEVGLARKAYEFHERVELAGLRARGIPDTQELTAMNIGKFWAAHDQAVLAEAILVWIEATSDPDFSELGLGECMMSPLRICRLENIESKNVVSYRSVWLRWPVISAEMMELLYRFSIKTKWAKEPELYLRRMRSISCMQRAARLDCRLEEQMWPFGMRQYDFDTAFHVAIFNVILAIESEAADNKEVAQVSLKSLREFIFEFGSEILDGHSDRLGSGHKRIGKSYSFNLPKLGFSFVASNVNSIDVRKKLCKKLVMSAKERKE